MRKSDGISFTTSDVLEIASKLALDDNTFVIGGQATNFWAWYYADRHPDLSSERSFTSQDIDYYGSLKAARAVAHALQGTVRTPSGSDMNTPNTAVVEAVFNGKPLRIDFLDGVLGVDRRSLRSGISIVEVAAEVGGETRRVRIAVMNPVNCLKSRIGNMMSVATRRRDDLAFRQLHASVAVVEVFLADALADGDIREVCAVLSELFEFLRSHEFGRHAEAELGIDLLGLLRRFRTDERLDARFREMTLAGMIGRIERARMGGRDQRLGPPDV